MSALLSNEQHRHCVLRALLHAVNHNSEHIDSDKMQIGVVIELHKLIVSHSVRAVLVRLLRLLRVEAFKLMGRTVWVLKCDGKNCHLLCLIFLCRRF